MQQLTRQRVRVLRALLSAGRALTPAEISSRADVSLFTVRNIVRTLCKDSWAERVDRWSYRLTPTGQALAREAINWPEHKPQSSASTSIRVEVHAAPSRVVSVRVTGEGPAGIAAALLWAVRERISAASEGAEVYCRESVIGEWLREEQGARIVSAPSGVTKGAVLRVVITNREDRGAARALARSMIARDGFVVVAIDGSIDEKPWGELGLTLVASADTYKVLAFGL